MTPRKATKQSRAANAAEKRFQDKLASYHCVLCSNHPVQIHHIYGSSWKLNRILVGHWLTLPLCSMCHRDLSLSRREQLKIWLKLVEDAPSEPIPFDVWEAVRREVEVWAY